MLFKTMLLLLALSGPLFSFAAPASDFTALDEQVARWQAATPLFLRAGFSTRAAKWRPLWPLT